MKEESHLNYRKVKHQKIQILPLIECLLAEEANSSSPRKNQDSTKIINTLRYYYKPLNQSFYTESPSILFINLRRTICLGKTQLNWQKPLLFLCGTLLFDLWQWKVCNYFWVVNNSINQVLRPQFTPAASPRTKNFQHHSEIFYFCQLKCIRFI